MQSSISSLVSRTPQIPLLPGHLPQSCCCFSPRSPTDSAILSPPPFFPPVAVLSSPIRAHIVMSMSVTVLESSTITVFTVPSNMRIFRGRCFFLYSMVSCRHSRAQLPAAAPVQGTHTPQSGKQLPPAWCSSGVTGCAAGHNTRQHSRHPRHLHAVRKTSSHGVKDAAGRMWDGYLPHCEACSSPKPSQPPARSLSLGLHPRGRAQNHWLKNRYSL